MRSSASGSPRQSRPPATTKRCKAARVRVEQLVALAELDDEALERALEDAFLAWGSYSQKTYQLRAQVSAERQRREAPDSHEAADADDSDGEEVLDS